MQFSLQLGGNHSAFAPNGSPADLLAQMSWWYVAGGLVVWAAVMATLLVALRRARTGRSLSDAAARRTVLYAGFVAPLTVLVAMLVYSVVVGRTLAAKAYKGTGDLQVRIEGHQYWWDVFYVRGGNVVARTANEIHLPVGQAIVFELESRDVIHSFWVPALGGKMDLIPGRRNELWLKADREGVYWGQCAEYCGAQHAHMGLEVVAQPRAQFDEWLQHQSESASAPTSELAIRGSEVFQAQSCALCHTIRGTQASANVGPDLTHLASRRRIAAGALHRDRGSLAGWISDAQAIKPGSGMPRITLAPADLQDLLAYLETLS